MKRFLFSLSAGVLFFVAFFAFQAPPVFGISSISLVQKVSSTTTTSAGSKTLTASLPFIATNGNTVIVTVSGWKAPSSVSLSDSLGNTYALAGTIGKSGSNEFLAIYYAKNINSGNDVITVTVATAAQISMTVAEFSGLDTSAPLDVSATAQGSSATPSSGLMTPSTAGELMISASTHGFTSVTTAGAGFTMLAVATEDDSAHQPLATEYQVLSNTTPVAATFSLAGSGSWVTNAVLFKPVVNVQTAPSIQSFVATPSSVILGGTSTLSWSVVGSPAPTVSIDNGVGAVTGTSVSVSPTATTTYTLTATNALGSVSTSTTLVVTPPDTTPPAVSMSAPDDQSTVSGITAISASAQDNTVVAGVQFFLDDVKIGVEDASTPYSINWNTASSTNGPHTLFAVARDAAGNSATSTVITIGVNNPAQLVIVQPTQNANIASSTVNILYTEQGGDMTGVDGVRFQLDGGPIMADTTFDGSFQLMGVSPGIHTLTGFLTQIAMMVPGSDAVPVTFTTTAPDTTLPVVSITAPAASSTLSGTVTITANASDNVGVAGVQFMIDGVNFGSEDTVLPYSVSWNTALASAGVHTITAVARDAALNMATALPISVTVVNPNDPALIGQWSAPVATPMVLVHGTLLKNGTLLVWAAGNQARIFDPTTGTYTPAPDNITDLLCAGEVVLSNGNLLSVGGEGFGPPSKHVDIFSVASSTWSAAAPMNVARWYPTVTVLSDGRILSTAGAATGGGYAPIPEIYNPKTNTWTMMAGSASNANTPNYPFMFVLPDGRVAFVGASEYDTLTQTLNINTQTWVTVDNRVLPGSSAVMYQPGKVMKSGEAADSGFSGPATSTTYVIDFNQPNPTWRKTANMANPRSFENLATLPDGTVLVTGGETTKDGANTANAVKAAELWNPMSETWATMASEQRPRLYHSISILMPDGRVFVSGGGSDAGVPDEMTSEYYSPGYLFKGARPTITSAPPTVQYGSTFFVATPDASNIVSVALIKATSVTHFTNMEQRFMNLSFSQTSGGITINAPANPNLATPGIYMLFIVNTNGVPSVAPFVTLPSSFDDTQAPTAPTNLVVSGSISVANLSWNASSDNVGVVNYNVYRSTVTGFTPSLANRIAQAATTTYSDSGLGAGTYYYKVTAQDAGGNVSSASNEASALVTADTQAPTVSITTPVSGSSVSGTIIVAANASDDVGVSNVQFQLDSTNLGTADTVAPYQMSWNTTTAANGAHTLTAIARDASGNVATSSPVAVITNNIAPPPSVLAIDKTVSKDQNSGNSITTASFSTASSSELLLAFISADGGSPNTTVTNVATAGLVWKLVQRTNTQLGTAEVWRAFATSTLSNVTVAATLSRSTASSMTILTFTGSNGSGTGGGSAIGATLGASAPSGAPTGTITTTTNNSWVFGVGTDYDNPIARTLGSNQSMVHQYLASVGDTYWVQGQTAPTPTSGTAVTINDTAPTTDRYNLSIVEVLPRS